MNLTPREKDKLMISLAAVVARGRLKRGVKLNYPESVALISDFVLEAARDGKSVAGAHVREPKGPEPWRSHGRYRRDDSRNPGGSNFPRWI